MKPASSGRGAMTQHIRSVESRAREPAGRPARRLERPPYKSVAATFIAFGGRNAAMETPWQSRLRNAAVSPVRARESQPRRQVLD